MIDSNINEIQRRNTMNENQQFIMNTTKVKEYLGVSNFIVNNLMKMEKMIGNMTAEKIVFKKH